VASSIKPGTHVVAIAELPLSLNPNSWRASIYGSAGARLLGVQVKRIFLTGQPSGSMRNLEDKIEKMQAELTALDAKAELIEQNRIILDKLAGQVATYATAFAAGCSPSSQKKSARCVLISALNPPNP
jgi:hypothetical protein